VPEQSLPRHRMRAASRTSAPSNAAAAAFLIWLQQPSRPPLANTPLAVAYSGGADSTALLHAARQHWPGPVTALHVHHGLQSAADGFEQHCRSHCAELGIPLRVAHVDARHKPGESPEERARHHRYHALAELARQAGAHTVALGQHADDQVETLLLALGRGAGLAGLAGMPASFTRHGMHFARPLLTVRAACIRLELQRAGIGYVQDPSNDDPTLTRNRIRQQLLPALAQTFASFHTTFARSAQHAAQAQLLLDQLAQDDAQQVGQPPQIAALRQLSRPRQANLLRHWLKTEAGSSGSSAQLEALLDQIAACATRGHRIELKIAGGQVRRNGSLLSYHGSLL
jgi:tRNA(Ile)-lysidine synthase